MGIFREYVLKIALTRSIFQLKMHEIPFGGRTRWGSLQRSPDPWLREGGGTRVEEGEKGSRGQGRKGTGRGPLFTDPRYAPAGPVKQSKVIADISNSHCGYSRG